MDQAQGASDRARAAGADRYVATHTVATDAMKARETPSHNAATSPPALNEALDSREHAQNAARREGADAKRSSAPRSSATWRRSLRSCRGQHSLAAATRARVPRRVLTVHARAGGCRRKRKGGRSGEGRRLPVGERRTRCARANHAGSECPPAARNAVFATFPLASVLQFRQVSLKSPYLAHSPSSPSPRRRGTRV
jgi:hypothetical protein